jgi:hypothetical protein
MGFIHGANRHEEILFPERLDDYIAEDTPHVHVFFRFVYARKYDGIFFAISFPQGNNSAPH